MEIDTEITFTTDTFGLRPEGGTGVIVGRNFFGDHVQSYVVRQTNTDREGYTPDGNIIVPADYVSIAN